MKDKIVKIICRNAWLSVFVASGLFWLMVGLGFYLALRGE